VLQVRWLCALTVSRLLFVITITTRLHMSKFHSDLIFLAGRFGGNSNLSDTDKTHMWRFYNNQLIECFYLVAGIICDSCQQNAVYRSVLQHANQIVLLQELQFPWNRSYSAYSQCGQSIPVLVVVLCSLQHNSLSVPSQVNVYMAILAKVPVPYPWLLST